MDRHHGNGKRDAAENRRRILILCVAVASIVLAALIVVSVILHRTRVSPQGQTPVTGADLIPVPVSAVLSDDRADWTVTTLLSPADDAYDDIFASLGFELGDGGVSLTVTTDASLEQEAYKLSVTREQITITASDRRGVVAAASTLSQLICDGRIIASDIEDKPAIPIRGVIEGFYGTAWTHEYRTDLFSFMGKYKLNTYIYAPKDDAKHREEWRSLYTEDERAKLKELVDCASDNNVRFVYAISPGKDIDLGAGYEKDYETLTEKCASVYALGVRDFAVLLDDIASRDAQGHARLVNDFQRKFIRAHDDCADLITIAPEYCNLFQTSYTDEFAQSLDPDIKVMWTGGTVIPSSVSASDLEGINAKLGRNVFLWWNYPVNDSMPEKLFMGPCVDLDTDLCRYVSGFVSNPMNQGYASMIPLLTVSDFLWNPSAYDPDRSIRHAIGQLYPECADGLYSLMDLTRGSLINGNRSSFSLSEDIDAYNNRMIGGAKSIRAKLETMHSDLTQLSDSDEEKLLSEIRPWLDKALSCVDAAIDYLDYEGSEDSDEKIDKALSFVRSYRLCSESPEVVSADVLMPFLYAAKEKINAVIGTYEASTVKKRTAFTDMPTYQTNVPANATDGDPSTLFWSSAAPKEYDCFTVDLGSEKEIDSVRLAMGDDYSPNDMIHRGVIEYSADGEKYTYLCDTEGALTESNTHFSARFVRVRCTETQTNWVIITAFDVHSVPVLPEGIAFDGSGSDLSPLFDRDLFTVFSPDPTEIGRKTLTFDVSRLTGVELFFVNTQGVRVTAEMDGGSSKEIALSGHTVVPTAGLRSVHIAFSDDANAQISEIIMK